MLLARLLLGRARAGVLCIAVGAFAAGLMWSVWIPSLAVRVDQETRDIARARAAPAPKRIVPPQALAAERASAFYSVLGDAAHGDQIVASLFKAASDAGVALDKGEYKPAHDRAGRFDTYSIVLPVKGDYRNIRRFCESVLLATPFASLDDIRFERASAGESVVKANLRFTMFIRADESVLRHKATGEVQR
jgi:hypothetical protein